LAKTHKAELVLIHVVDGVGGQWYGPQTGDLERRHDEAYLDALVERLGRDLAAEGVPKVEAVLGYGDPPSRSFAWRGKRGSTWWCWAARPSPLPRLALRRNGFQRPPRADHPGLHRAKLGNVEAW